MIPSTSGDSGSPTPRKLSLCDPSGSLFDLDGRLIRLVNPEFTQQTTAIYSSPGIGSLMERRSIIPTQILAEPEAHRAWARLREMGARVGATPPSLAMEHERVPFVSLPVEWSPEMLREAGMLTLEIAEQLLEQGMGLKDATPRNVLFVGPDPVFVDMLSIERREPADCIWLPFAQFMRMFLYPLIANRFLQLPVSTSFSPLQEGLEARDLYRLCGPMRRLTPYFLSWVSLPHWLSPRASRVPRHEAPHYPSGGDSEKARFILRTQFRRLRKALTRTIPLRRKVSDWADYASTLPTYSSDQAIEKRTFVETALAEFRPRSVLDVGCNTGDFSRLAARAGARVIGIDSDETAVGEAWKMARREKLDLLPLVVSLANPTAASGWRNRLYPSFLERASGRFDAVMLLAVLHHLLVKDLVPLEDILDLVCELTRSLAIVEFVDPTDPGFQALARGRKYPQLSRRAFELECEHRFSIIRSHPLQGNHRCLYVLEKKR